MGDNESKIALWRALGLAWELGYTIAVPLVILALAGRLLDKRWGTEPWLLLVGLSLSVFISSWAVYRKTKKIVGQGELNKPTEKKDNI
ncbi:MAG: AtpZ/AtpI family protein [Patescibacteria group bacterium]